MKKAILAGAAGLLVGLLIGFLALRPEPFRYERLQNGTLYRINMASGVSEWPTQDGWTSFNLPLTRSNDEAGRRLATLGP